MFCLHEISLIYLTLIPQNFCPKNLVCCLRFSITPNKKLPVFQVNPTLPNLTGETEIFFNFSGKNISFGRIDRGWFLDSLFGIAI